MSSDKLEISEKFWFTAVSLMLGKLSKKRSRLMEESEFVFVKDLYEACEGSWEGLAEGTSECWEALRTCCKTYLKYCKEHETGPFEPGREA